jgi:hypothetical protein
MPDARRTALLKNDQLRMGAPSMLESWKHLASFVAGACIDQLQSNSRQRQGERFVILGFVM